MKAVSCKQGQLSLVDLPEVSPEKGHVVLEVLRCGICGSDLHARGHCNHVSKLAAKAGMDRFMSADQDVVMGHEFVGEILDYGQGCNKKMKPGTRVCALPFIDYRNNYEMIGWSQHTSGAYAERMLVQESMMVAVPNGLSNDLAALTEPMAVGLHAVNRAQIKKDEVAVVVGCGPVGIAIICCLKARGVKNIVASDFSAKRRQLALQCGADVTIDPAKESPFKNWQDYGHTTRMDSALGMLFQAKADMDKLPIPWWHVWNIADKLGATAPKRPVVFECVGVPGILQNLIEGAPLFSRIVVAGVCMAQDVFEPALGIQKEVDLIFVIGYSPLEFRQALHLIANGKVNVSPLITGVVGLAGIESAFDALGDPEQHAKILVDPQSSKLLAS